MDSRWRSTSIVIAANLLSAILAFGREAAIAYRFGASAVTDAYFLAILIPTTLQFLLGAGTLNPVFIPVFMDYMAHGDERTAWNTTNTVINLLTVGMSLLVIVQVAAAPWLVAMLAPGFDVETTHLATHLVRIVTPSVLFLVLASLCGGVLNAHKRFLLSSLAPPLANVIVILAVFTLSAWWGVVGLAVGTVIAAAGQFFVQLLALFRLGYRYTGMVDLKSPGVMKIARLLGPMLASVVVLQIGPIAERLLASMTGEGNIAVLNYGFKITQMPFQVFAMATATVSLPFFAQRVSSLRDRLSGDHITSSILTLLFLVFPSVVFVFTFRVPLVRLLLERGAFTPEASIITASVLGWYVLGLLPYAMNALLLQLFYAFKNTVVPFLINLVFVITSVGIALWFLPLLRLNAIPIGWSIGMGVAMAILVCLVEIRITPILRQRFFLQICKLLIASMVMLVVCHMFDAVNNRYQGLGLAQSLLGLAAAGVLGCITYFSCAWLLRADPAMLLCRNVRAVCMQVVDKLS